MLKKILHRRGWSWYAAKTPKWLMWVYPKLLWRMKTKDKVVYLTFDDGPIPEVTEFVLDILQQHQVKAHFFCIGKNVIENPDIYQRILQDGHVVGNHTMNHLNGWKTKTDEYIANVNEASTHIHSNLFRPPYGRIKKSQIQKLQKNQHTAVGNNIVFRNSYFKLIMWDVLSGDFDTSIDAEKCYQNVIENIQAGSIIVFHDSEKAFPRMKLALPKVLNWLKQHGYEVKLIDKNC
jgi:peptidoglycan-N-acetylglucosamine deacetylase